MGDKPYTPEEIAGFRQLQNQQWPPGHLQAAQRPYHPNQLNAPNAAPTAHYALRLSDEDVQRIAIAVVARLEALRGSEAP